MLTKEKDVSTIKYYLCQEGTYLLFTTTGFQSKESVMTQNESQPKIAYFSEGKHSTREFTNLVKKLQKALLPVKVFLVSEATLRNRWGLTLNNPNTAEAELATNSTKMNIPTNATSLDVPKIVHESVATILKGREVLRITLIGSINKATQPKSKASTKTKNSKITTKTDAPSDYFSTKTVTKQSTSSANVMCNAEREEWIENFVLPSVYETRHCERKGNLLVSTYSVEELPIIAELDKALDSLSTVIKLVEDGLKELPDALSLVDRKLTDLDHLSEFNDITPEQASQLLTKRQQLLRERRYIKDTIRVCHSVQLSNLRSFYKLQNSYLHERALLSDRVYPLRAPEEFDDELLTECEGLMVDDSTSKLREGANTQEKNLGEFFDEILVDSATLPHNKIPKLLHVKLLGLEDDDTEDSSDGEPLMRIVIGALKELESKQFGLPPSQLRELRIIVENGEYDNLTIP